MGKTKRDAKKMSDVKSADKKPQIYTDPNTGKKRIRMVAKDRKVVDKDKDQKIPTSEQKVDEISIKDLTKKVSNSTGLKNVNKAMNKDKVKNDLAKMKARLAADKPVTESVDTNRVKQLGTLGLVDKKDVQRLMTIMKKLDSDKDLNIREKDMVVDMFQQLIAVVTGDVSTFSKTKKAVSEEVEDLEEISKEKAADYHAKSVQYQKDALRSDDPKKLKKIGNRLIGVQKANKIMDKK